MEAINITSERQPTLLEAKIRRAAAVIFTFALSVISTMAPMMAAAYESFTWVRLGEVLTILLLLHLMTYPRLLFTRELALYIALLAYMTISLVWAPSMNDGLNTLMPAVDFVLITLLFGSLTAFHNLRCLFTGMLVGFVTGAVIYTLTVGFPLTYPEDFSYNAIAGMYLFGLVVVLFFAWLTRQRLLPLMLGLAIMMHIAATTSIKTNLGIVLGAVAAALVYLARVLRVLRRTILFLGIFVAVLLYAIASNEDLLERVQNGLDRVSHGVEILERRDDAKGDTSFGERTEWTIRGIRGWLRSPLFGNGVEAFRTDYGITSHSTPIDLLYNFGIVGFALFYAIFASIMLRLIRVPRRELGSLPALIFAGAVCYGFITLSGTMHYNMFLAIFIAISAALLQRLAAKPPAAPMDSGR
jgi:O-antigen ligase